MPRTAATSVDGSAEVAAAGPPPATTPTAKPRPPPIVIPSDPYVAAPTAPTFPLPRHPSFTETASAGDKRVVIVEDPEAYRPATPILNWRGPARSTKPPKLQLWIAITVLCVVQNVCTAVVPRYVGVQDSNTFLSVWIALTSLLIAIISYMSTTRHLHHLVMLMESINTPRDMDLVVERLQKGRFSRFEETWKVQVHIIFMFCRLLRHHHKVRTTAVDEAGGHPLHHHHSHHYVYGAGGGSRSGSLATSFDEERSATTSPTHHTTKLRSRTSSFTGVVGGAADEQPPAMKPLACADTVGSSGNRIPATSNISKVSTASFDPLNINDDGGDDDSASSHSMYSVCSTVDLDGSSSSPRRLKRSLVKLGSRHGGVTNESSRAAQTPPSPVATVAATPTKTNEGDAAAAAPPLVTVDPVAASSRLPRQSSSTMLVTTGASGSGFGSSFNVRPPHLRRHGHNGDPLGDNERDWPDVLSSGPGGGSMDAESRSILISLLRQISPGQELSKVVLPVHILEPRSLLEKLSDLFVHPDLFAAIAAPHPSPVERMVSVVRWYISGFHIRPQGAKKPYNPVLGETFECVFQEGTAHEVYYFAEQVSHHPPITAFRAVHQGSGLELAASYVPRSRLVSPNCGASVGEGALDLIVSDTGESYHFTWPSAYVGGLLSPPLRLEVVGDVSIHCAQTGVKAEVSFVRKGWFGGEYDVVKGFISHAAGVAQLGSSSSTGSGVAYSFTGKWNSQTLLHKHVAGSKVTVDTVLLDPDTIPAARPRAGHTVFPKPSRLVWKDVTVALRAGNAAAAQQHKVDIEGREREERRAREARGEVYVPGFFRIIGQKKGPGKDTWRYVPPAATAVLPQVATRSAFLARVAPTTGPAPSV